MKDDVAFRRLAKAVAVVVAMFAALGVCSALGQGAAPPEEEAVDDPFLDGSMSADVLERVQTMLQKGEGAPTEDFLREIGVLEGSRNTRASGNVVGYIVDEDPSIVWGRIEEMMQGRCWEERPMSGALGAMFVKRGGVCTWALITCNQVGAATSVVVRYG